MSCGKKPTGKGSQEGERTENSQTTLLTKAAVMLQFVAMGIVAVYLEHCTENRNIKVNALIDEASSKSYLNSDIAAALGLSGTSEEMIVNVLNGNQTKFHTTVVDFKITSMDGEVSKAASAYTTERVTGDMNVVDWNLYKITVELPEGHHLTASRTTTSYQDLLYSIRDVRGKPGEPIARLTPLGWTCIGSLQNSRPQNHANFAYFADPNMANNLDYMIRRFWDIDESTETEDKVARDAVSESLTFEDGHYTIGMPWKSNKYELSDNYSMALQRLQNTDKRLLRSTGLGDAYCDVLTTYQTKGYIRKVSPEEKNPDHVWYLPHFPVLRPDKTTTKTRIVFDASAK